LAGQPGGAIDK